MSELVLQMKAINKYFGSSHVIKDVNMDIPKGAFVTFLGPSGCGKTTLLRMVAGFYEPDEGEILLNDKRIEKLPPYERNTAMVFQEYALFPHMSVFDNVMAAGLLNKCNKKELVKKANELYPDLTAFFTGDFNVTPDSAPCKAVKDGGFTDCRDIAETTDKGITFHAFMSRDEYEGTIIDYVFKKGDVKVKNFTVIRDTIDGEMPSDHYPVYADIEF